MLEALAHALGAEVRRMPPLPDGPGPVRAFLAGPGRAAGPAHLRRRLRWARRTTCPGVLEALGARILFHKIRLKPGKPMLTALLDGRVILGLPGNPVSSYINALLFLPVALAGLQGRRAPDPWKQGRLAGSRARTRATGPSSIPAGAEGPRLHPLASRGSADLVRLAQADAFAWIPEGGMGPGETRYLDVV